MTKLWVLVQLAAALSMAGEAIAAGSLPVTAQESVGEWASRRVDGAEQSTDPSTHPPIYPPTLAPATTVTEWIAQVEASLTQITGVRVEETEAGLQIVLETAEGELAAPTTQTVGNALIAEIPNAVLALPDSESFEQFGPAEGIALVSVTNEPGVGGASPAENRVRVAITGTDAPPVAEVTATGLSVILGEAVAGADDDAIQVVVTGEQDGEDYFVPDASTATRTETPILDIPASIQVIPQQVLEDQQVTRLDEALQNSSSVIYNSTDTFSDVNYSIRGFDQAVVLIDGFRQYDFVEVPEVANIERLEILRGPASILYGEIQPGGVINLVTEQPLSEPFYEAEFQAGSFGLIRPQFDISGPLTDDEQLLYRLNGVYSRRIGFRDFDQDFEQFFAAPVLTWEISDRTNLTVDAQISNREQPFDFGRIAFGDEVIDTPRDRIFNEPDDFLQRDFLSIRLALDHQFGDEWSVRSAFRFSDSSVFSDQVSIPIAFDETTGLLTRVFALDDFDSQNYSLQTNLIGEFGTGPVNHTLLFGVDLSRTETSEFALASFTPFPINVFDPDYGIDLPEFDTLLFDTDTETDRLGLYLQDQIELLDNLILVLGVRYDNVEQRIDNVPALFAPTGDTTQNDDALTPRVGIVYQPIEDLALYGSYSQSFNPNEGVDTNGNAFEPERGEGFEIGVKSELFDDSVLATLAYFNVTRQNILTEDPNFPGLGIEIATGEQRSQGFEFDITGEILPGWNVIASYTYTDAEVTEDNTIPEGNQLTGIPLNSANLWTTYEIQRGDLQGLGFGVGFSYIGYRQGDLANTFELDSYFLANAAVFYRRDNWRAALNFRNLFNVDYTNSSGRFGSRTSAGLPGEPFAVVGSISVNF